MPFGIIQPNGGHAPGTVLLVDRHERRVSANFVHGTGKNENIILIPQPSSDPNDPLNWPTWKKDVVLLTIFINAIIFASVPAPLLAPSIFVLATIFDMPLTKISELSGNQLLVVGCIGPIVSAFARKYGKRPQFIFAAVMGVIGTAVSVGSGTSYNTLLAGRIIQGFGTTAFESLSVALVGDLYFVHERGIRTGLIVLTLTAMSSVVSIIGGPITEHLGWRYMFIILLPFTVAGALSIFFLVPETQFRRNYGDLGRIPELMSDLTAQGQQAGDVKDCDHESQKDGSLQPTISVASNSSAQRKSYVQSLAIHTGTYSDSNLFILFLQPFLTLFNPAVIWTLIDAGVIVAMYVSIAYILSQIFSVPPYNLTSAGNGFFYVGGLLGGLIGGIGGAYLCNLSTKTLTRLNKGTHEPEFRIPVQIFAALLFGLGYFLFMWDLEHPTPHGYFFAAFCHGCICAGITLASTSASLYILDAFREQATDIFILQMMTKNLLFYGFSTFVNDWTAEKGAPVVFRTYGIVALCIMTTCVPMYVFGKVIRRFVHGSGFLGSLWVDGK